MDNPYHAPAADFAQSIKDVDTYAATFAALHGRIGRARYLAYTLLPSFAMILATDLLDRVVMDNSPVAELCTGLVYIPVIALLFVMCVRRLNDMNLSGWLSLLGLIPVVNLILWLGLLAAPGTAGANRHGAAPGKNTLGVLIAAWAGPIAIALAIGHLVVMPMIQHATEKAGVAPRAPHDIPARK